ACCRLQDADGGVERIAGGGDGDVCLGGERGGGDVVGGAVGVEDGAGDCDQGNEGWRIQIFQDMDVAEIADADVAGREHVEGGKHARAGTQNDVVASVQGDVAGRRLKGDARFDAEVVEAIRIVGNLVGREDNVVAHDDGAADGERTGGRDDRFAGAAGAL